MADLSVYLFWAGLVVSLLASAGYIAYVASAAFAVRRMTAATELGTVTVAAHGPARPHLGLGRLATMLATLCGLILLAAVGTRWVAVEHPPFSNMYEFTVAFGACMAVSYVAFEAVTGQRRAGVLALPLVAIMLGIATQFPSDVVPLIPALQNGPLLAIHVAAMMVSYSVLSVAFCGAVIYLAQGGMGRERRFAFLPSAEAAGDLAHRATVVGFPILVAGVALGAWWANDAWGRYWGWDPKETSALMVGLTLAAYFHARAGGGSVLGAPGIRKIVPQKIRAGWRPDPMWWLVVSYAMILFTYFVVNLWITGLHSYAGV